MKRKKQGSSLITVVIIFSILIIVGAAMLSMSVGDYKMRIVESKRIQNLYNSESGLDVAYDIIVKTFDKATEFGYFKARQLEEGNSQGGPNKYKYDSAKTELNNVLYDSDSNDKEKKSAEKKFNETVEKLMEDEFKRSFKNFIMNTDSVKSENIDDNILATSITNSKYSNIDLKNKDPEKDTIERTNDFSPIDTRNIDAEIFVCNDEKVNELKVIINGGNEENSENTKKITNIKNDYSGIMLSTDDKSYTISVTSLFKSNQSNSSIGKNIRMLQCKYTINVPEYKDISFKEITSTNETYAKIKNKAIVVGQDMSISGDGQWSTNNQDPGLTIDGNVFVQGNKNLTSGSKVYSKYNGGIDINNSKTTFNKDVITASTFNISDNANVTLNNDLYALNIYAGEKNGEYANKLTQTKESLLNIEGNTLVDNDLTLKGINTKINLRKNFYGLNDKNITEDSIEGDLSRTSSSIIVNGYQNSQIVIDGDAYILGVAHIYGGKDEDDTKDYQTGESIAVKGNYIAYSKNTDNPYVGVDNPSENFYHGDLEFKGKKFTTYWRNPTKINDINDGGVKLNGDNNKSIGASVYRNKSGDKEVKDGTYTAETFKEIEKQKCDYASKVYNMKDIPENKLYTADEKTELLKVYNSLGKDYNPINLLINLYNIPESYHLESQCNKENKAIFNSNPNKKIIIKGKSSLNDPNNLIIDDKSITINASSTNQINAVIVTAGDISIEGDVNFNGNIITEKNLFITGKGTITNDNDLVSNIYQDNKDVFDKVFVDDVSEDKKGTSVESNTKLSVDYDLNKFLKKNIWKIIK